MCDCQQEMFGMPYASCHTKCMTREVRHLQIHNRCKMKLLCVSRLRMFLCQIIYLLFPSLQIIISAGIEYVDSGWPACHSSTVTICSFWPGNCDSECWKLKFKFLNVFLYEREWGNVLLYSEQDIWSVCMSDILMTWTSINIFNNQHVANIIVGYLLLHCIQLYSVSQKSEPPKHFAITAANLRRFK